MSSFLITLLTSSNLKYLKTCYESVKNQKFSTINYTIVIIVNTQNDNYYNIVLEEFPNDIVVRTESNGRAGKGHNSLLSYFNEHKEFDYLIPIDGDDILYPCALQRIEIYMEYNPDILILPFSDIITKDHNKGIIHYGIENRCYLNFNNELDMRSQWYRDKASPFEYNINDTNTPGRLLLMSRKALNLNLNYDEVMKWYDDYNIFLQVFEAHVLRKDYNIFMVDDKDIYLYNRLNEDSVTELFKIDNERKKLEEEKQFRKAIFNKFLTIRDWNLKNLTFLTSDFNLSFSINQKIEFVKEITKKMKLEHLNINTNSYNKFYLFAKTKKFKELELFFKNVLE